MNPRTFNQSSSPAVQLGKHVPWPSALVGAWLLANFCVAFAQDAVSRAELPAVKVGDRWKFETRDKFTGAKLSESDEAVTAITASQIEGTTTAGKTVWTPEWSILESPSFSQSGDARYLNFPLEVGRKWDFKFYRTLSNGTKLRLQFEATVAAQERVKVPAGEFVAFKIEYSGYFNNETFGRNGRIKNVNWYAPTARRIVKTEIDDTINRTITELVELQLQP